MGTIHSLTGATAGTDTNWGWCIPALSMKLPIVILVMTSDGPRYMPTPVEAPRDLRPRSGTYREVRPDARDFELADAVYQWALLGHQADAIGVHHLNAMAKVHAICTARRFLPVRSIVTHPADQPIAPEDLYLGRSLQLRERGHPKAFKGWLVSESEPFEVVVHNASRSQFECVVADIVNLGEDGTAHILKK